MTGGDPVELSVEGADVHPPRNQILAQPRPRREMTHHEDVLRYMTVAFFEPDLLARRENFFPWRWHHAK